MIAETLHLASTHECLHFTFTDNALPPKEADQFFEKLSGKGVDFDFFAEIRSITGLNVCESTARLVSKPFRWALKLYQPLC